MLNRIVQELTHFFVNDLGEYVRKALDGIRLAWACVIAAANYLLFPDSALMVALCCVLGAAGLDLVTRWISTRRHRVKWSSDQFWQGTGVKLVAYLAIAFLAGLSYRLSPLMQQPTVFLWTVAYVVMFLREVQSNLENLSDMGADVGWLLSWVKRKEQQLLEVEPEQGGQPASTEEERPPEQ